MLDGIFAHCQSRDFLCQLQESAGPRKEVQVLGSNGGVLQRFVLKDRPEDFQVSEELEIGAGHPAGASQAYLRIEKRALSTDAAVRILSGRLGVPLKEIGRAGLKDKQAIASQWLSVPYQAGLEQQLARLDTPGLAVLEVRYGTQPIGIGMHSSNLFRIVLRAVEPEFKVQAGDFHFPNYYDTQRAKLTSASLGELLYGLQQRQPDAIGIFLGRMEQLPLRLQKADSQVRWAMRILAERRQDGVRALLEKFSIADKREYLSALSGVLWNFQLSQLLVGSGPEVLLAGNALGTVVVPAGVQQFQAKTLRQAQVGTSNRYIERPAIAVARIRHVAWAGANVTLELTLPKGSYATMAVKCLALRSVMR
ncbi:MAG: tRNA pseudouridine(13) synthase TruD [Candidatus Aenigmarchaeota archaeon]|nr:tRNA pseudouridine(13) synthase TruD [Candidatus Aenigmarchaeota archaeon]